MSNMNFCLIFASNYMSGRFSCQEGSGIALERIELSLDPELEELEEIVVKPKSTHITLELFGLAWMPKLST